MTDALTKLRKLCLGLPETTEQDDHGEPVWFVRKKRFVSYAAYHHDGRDVFWCAAPAGVQEELTDGKRYFRPPYIGHRGWLGVYLDTDPDWDEIAEIVEDAYRTVAPKTLAAQLPQR